MHVELPKSKNLKEFGREYVMIVISILTALLLEQGAETLHHRHLVHEAGQRIEAELHANVDAVDKALAHNEQKRAALMTVRAQMLDDLRHHVGAAAWMQRFRSEWRQAIDLSLQNPMLRREAWEAAVANQSLSWMPRDQLERYATAYSSMRETTAVANGSGNHFLDAPHMLDVVSDIQMGEGDPKAIFRMVNQMISLYSSYDGNLDILKNALVPQAAAPHARD